MHGMRGDDQQTGHLFSYLSPEAHVPGGHPLRAVRQMTDEALTTLSRQFDALYADTGRPSIPPEQLLRALLIQVLYTVPSELVCRTDATVKDETCATLRLTPRHFGEGAG